MSKEIIAYSVTATHPQSAEMVNDHHVDAESLNRSSLYAALAPLISSTNHLEALQTWHMQRKTEGMVVYSMTRFAS
jgi:hypothetical protein